MDIQNKVTVDASIGSWVLDVAREHDKDIQGSCNGNLACATCHVHIPDEKPFELMPEAKEDEENMLDSAFDVNYTSRLCCQLFVTKDYLGSTESCQSAPIGRWKLIGWFIDRLNGWRSLMNKLLEKNLELPWSYSGATGRQGARSDFLHLGSIGSLVVWLRGEWNLGFSGERNSEHRGSTPKSDHVWWFPGKMGTPANQKFDTLIYG